jgi:thiamine-monophosphate kinase
MPYPQNMHSKRLIAKAGTTQGELAILRQIRARASQTASTSLRLGIGDDCALLRLRSGEELAITTDLSIAGRHFRLDWHQPESIGHRALARGLSDLAAMGARPVAAFLSIGLPRELTTSSTKRRTSWLQRFLDGLFALAAAHKTPLAGGDLSESTTPLADIVLVGAVPSGKALLRSGARPGHLLYVTGDLGGSAAGLAKLGRLAHLAEPRSARPTPPRIPKKLDALLAPQLYPQPRIAQGLWLQRHALASAAIDLSDGLSTDLTHLCEESKVAAEVDASLLPIHQAATETQALHGGEDYELLFTAAASARVPKKIAGIPVTRIGRIVAARANHPTVSLITPQGRKPLEARGWEHFDSGNSV